MPSRVLGIGLVVVAAGCATAADDTDGFYFPGDGGKKDSGKDFGVVDSGGGDTEPLFETDPDAVASDGDPDSGDSGGGPFPCPPADPGGCTTAALSLGSVSGDKGGTKTATGSEGKWFHVNVTEDDSSLLSSEDLKVRITLDSPAGENFDLFVYKGKAKGDGGGVECSSLAKSSTEVGASDVVSLGWNDNRPVGGFDDSATLSIEVRAVTPTCDPSLTWTLTVEGDK